MTDATIVTIDHEPWNQRPAPVPIAPTVEPLHTVYHRVTRRIPIFSAPGVHAAFVYDACGTSVKPGPCEDCAGIGITEMWQEWEWKPGTCRFDYLPTRCFALCEACGGALLALPIGQRWHRSRKKAAVLARCIRALDAVGHGKAVEALRALVESEKKPGVMDVFSRVARRELTPEEGARLLHK